MSSLTLNAKIFLQRTTKWMSNQFIVLLGMIVLGMTNITFGQSAPNVQLMVFLQQPVSPYLPELQQDLVGGNTSQINNSLFSKLRVNIISLSQSIQNIKLTASIQRISPSPMSIEVDPNYQPPQPLIIAPNENKLLNKTELDNSFGGFSSTNIVYNDFDINELRENGVNYKLPEGNYRLCIRAYDYDMPGAFIEQCVYFNICYTIAAPQFILPFNTLTQFEPTFENLKPISAQIQFQWIPPTSTCGLPLIGLYYDISFIEVLEGQSMQSSLFSIPVFSKQNIYTNMFAFDTLLYAGILRKNHKYIVRVKANVASSANSAIEIENDGYSQILAFIYQPDSPQDDESNSTGDGAGIENMCEDIPDITPANPFTGNLVNQELTIGLFKMTVTEATKNNDDSYTGIGTIPWKPFNTHTVQMAVKFQNIKVNENLYITNGKVITSTDPTMPPKVVDLAGISSISNYVGISKSDINSIENRINKPANTLNQIQGNNSIFFPMGLENQSIAVGNATIAIMGITFTSKGTSMNILFNLDIPDASVANEWISLGGTNFCIKPTGFSFNKGLLYLPEDKTISFSGMKMIFKKTVLNQNQLLDATSTHLSWNKDGLEKVVINADFELLGNDLIPLDVSGKRILGENIVFNAKFNFTKWSDWVAQLTVNHDFEIKRIKGFKISCKEGMSYDHSNTRNPDGITFPKGFAEKGNAINSTFKGFYMKNLTFKLPDDFVTSEIMDFGFHDFIINNNGVSTSIQANNILTLQKGSVAGWGLSIDTFNITFVNSAPYQDMGMKGRIQMPISETALKYNCILNVGSNMDSLNYNFSIIPQSDIKMDLWKATLTFADHSSTFSIVKANGKTVAEAHMNGGISIKLTDPIKVNIPLLTFHDFFVSSKDGIGIGSLSIGNSSIEKNNTGSIYDWRNNEYNLAKGGPNPGNNYFRSSGNSQESNSSEKISGFSFNIKDFALEPKGIDTFGLFFSLNLNIGADDLGMSVGTRIGIIGKIDKKQPSFVKLELDSIGIDGDFGPIKIKGYLKFNNNDTKYGDGIHGRLEADFIVGKITAQAYFGSMGSYDYFGIGGSFYSSVGIPLFAGLIMNGFGGGFYHNMKFDEALPDSSLLASLPDNSPSEIAVSPSYGTSVLQANLLLSLANPELLNMNASVLFQLSSSNGLEEMKIKAYGYSFSNPPANNNAMAKADVNLTIGFSPHTFVDGHLEINFNAGPINITAPISFFSGYSQNDAKDIYYLYIGTPDNRVNADILKVGKEGDAIWALLKANAYFCLGSQLPPFPDLPTEVKDFLRPRNGSQVSGSGDKGSSNQGVLALLRNNPASGFMFGASVTAGAGLDFAIFYAKLGGTIGFDMALLQYKEQDAFKSCSGVDGKPGVDGWYALGQLYAYFGMEIGVHLGLGDLDLLGVQLGAVLQGGGPNPTWAQGTVKIEVDLLMFSCNTSADFEIGSTCYPEYNPLRNVTLIENICTDKIGVYSKPWVTYNVPVHNQNYISYTMPPDKTHPNSTWTKRIFFEEKILSFKKLKTNNSSEQNLIGLVSSIKGSDEKMSFFKKHSAWFGDATYKVEIQCNAYTMIKGIKEILLSQDTVFSFTTGPAAKNLNDEIIADIYPVPGQRYLLKDELDKKGVIKFTVWPSDEGEDPMKLKANDYEKLIQFIPLDGSPTITTPFVANYRWNSLTYVLPDELKNSLGYKMVFITSPNNAVDQFKAKEDTIDLKLADLIKSKTSDYSVVISGNNFGKPSNNAVNYNSNNASPPNNFSLNTNILASNNAINFNVNSIRGVNTSNITEVNINNTMIPELGVKEIEIRKNKTYVDATAKYGMLIYSLDFRTSKYNTLAEKVATYSSVQTQKATYFLYDNAIDFTLGGGLEQFDVFEVNGYTRSTNDGTIMISPLLLVQIPYDYSSSMSSINTNYFDGINTHFKKRFTSSNGNDGWIMDNIYFTGRELLFSIPISTMNFKNKDNSFISRLAYIQEPSADGTNYKLYTRDNWIYSPKYTSNGRPLIPKSNNNIRFKWNRDVVSYADYIMVTKGLERWLEYRKIIKATLQMFSPQNFNFNYDSKNDILGVKLILGYINIPISNINTKLSFSLFGGEMIADPKWFYNYNLTKVEGTNGLYFYEDKTTKAFENAVNNFLNMNKSYKYFNNVSKRNIQFLYYSRYIGYGNKYNTTFNFKR